MSDIIQLLPDSVANQIAAGEVIQRPASVIKELVENAIDAGATRIDVLVVDAGRTSIQVIDNGKGMSETDARLSFERHATSKIRQAGDLFELRTMGFRGFGFHCSRCPGRLEDPYGNRRYRNIAVYFGKQVFRSGAMLLSCGQQFPCEQPIL